MISCVKPPVILNGWKHHLGFVRKTIENLCKNYLVSDESISKSLKFIGQSQFDLYTGLFMRKVNKSINKLSRIMKNHYFKGL